MEGWGGVTLEARDLVLGVKKTLGGGSCGAIDLVEAEGSSKAAEDQEDC